MLIAQGNALVNGFPRKKIIFVSLQSGKAYISVNQQFNFLITNCLGGGVALRSKHLIYAIQGRATGSVLDFFMPNFEVNPKEINE